MSPPSARAAISTSRTSPFRACSTAASIRPPAIGATLVSVDEASDRAASRRSRCPHRELPRGRGGRRVGGGEGVARARGDMDRVARAAWSRQPRALSSRRRRRARSGDCEPRAIGADRRRRSVRRGARGGAGVSNDDDGGDLLLAVSEPRVAGAVVRRRRRSRRRRHDLDVVAGHLRPARHAVARLRPRAREDARRLHGGVGIVRHERRRPCRGRRRAPLEDHRQAGARAVVASGRARLGSEGPAAAARPARGPRCRRPDRRVGHADVDSRQPPRRADPAGGAVSRAFPRTAGATPPRSSRTAIRPYPADHVRVLAHWMRDTPLNPSNLRAPGKPANVFAVESFTDEIAASLRVDALEFRVGAPDRSARARGADARVDGVRLAAAGRRPNPAGPVERPAASGAAWLTRATSRRRTTSRRSWRSRSTRESGAIAVRRVVCAHDCGLVVNPEALRNQIEGGIVQTLSRALHEEVQFDESRRHERRLGDVSDPEVPRGAGGRGDPGRAARPGVVGRGRSVDGAPSRRRSGTPCSTPPASACAGCRSPPRGSRPRWRAGSRSSHRFTSGDRRPQPTR